MKKTKKIRITSNLTKDEIETLEREIEVQKEKRVRKVRRAVNPMRE